MKRIILAMVAVATVAGCGDSKVMTRAPEASEAYRSARAGDGIEPGIKSTSLWRPEAELTRAYDDHRARRIGDLVTVIVSEASEASRQASTNLGHDSSVDVGVDAFLGMPKHLGLSDIYAGGGDFSPEIKLGSGNSFNGSGTTKRSDTLKTRVAARVMEILPDGNMVVEGKRQVTVNDEVQYLHVRGIARPVDISPANTISSTALADAEILCDGTGAISSEQKPGWLYRLISAVWPF